MRNPRSLARFVAIAALVFGVAMIPSRTVERAYAKWFRASLGSIFALTPRADVTVEPLGRRARDADTRITLASRTGPAHWSVGLHSRGSGWLPTCVFAALLLASPIGWRRRAFAALAGGLLLHLYLAFAAAAVLLEQLSKHASECGCLRSRASWLYSDWWRDSGSTLLPAMRLEPTVFLLAPVLIWAVTCFRAEDWRELIAPRPSATSAPHDDPALRTRRGAFASTSRA